jgi:ABC-type Fe3+ transport system substrate-binding protein
MGRLGRADRGDQAEDGHPRAVRQQELGPGDRATDRRAESPVADVVYLGVSSAFQAKDKGVIAPYRPAHWNDIPANLKDPQGYWFAIHSGTLGFFVNKDALDGKPVPRSWADLLKPEYKGWSATSIRRARSSATRARSR